MFMVFLLTIRMGMKSISLGKFTVSVMLCTVKLIRIRNTDSLGR